MEDKVFGTQQVKDLEAKTWATSCVDSNIKNHYGNNVGEVTGKSGVKTIKESLQ